MLLEENVAESNLSTCSTATEIEEQADLVHIDTWHVRHLIDILSVRSQLMTVCEVEYVVIVSTA